MNNHPTQPPATSAFPYTVPFTNPYTQRKSTTQPTSSYNNHHSRQNASQQELEQALSVLGRSSNVPSTQNIENLFELVRRANEQTRNNHASSSSSSSSTTTTTSCWTLSMAEHLATFVVRLFACHDNINMTGRNPEGYPSTLCFLSRCLEEWVEGDDAMLLYAVAVQPLQVPERQTNNNGHHRHSTRTVQRSLLEVLHHLVVHFQDPIVQLPAMAGLATIWRYLDRVQLWTRWNSSSAICDSNFSLALDTAWWMPVADESGIASLALGELLRENQEDAYPKVYIFPDRKELQMASATILTCFLKHDRTHWLQQLALEESKESLRNLSQNLLGAVHRLADSSVTSSQILHQSMASASLLCLLDSKETLEHSNEFNQLVYSTKLLDNVFRSYFGIFGASNPSGPRWSYENNDAGTLQCMEDFIFHWSLGKDGSTRKLAIDAQERYWREPIEQCWGSLLREDYSQPGEWSQNMKRCRAIFSRLVLMTSVHHSSLHKLLNNTLAQAVRNQNQSIDMLVQPCQRILQSLQHLTLHRDLGIATCAASTIKSLLGGRASITTHDELSRSIWNAVDLEFVQKCIQRILHLSKTKKNQSTDPLLLSLLDILDLLLSSDSLLHEVIQVVDTECLETLIHLMAPKDIRIDQAGTFMNSSLDSTVCDDTDTETPPANNLSRLDEQSICIEKEEEEPVNTGIGRYIRTSVATVLSRFGYLDINNIPPEHHNGKVVSISDANAHSLRLLQSRIRATVTDFFSASADEHCDDTPQSDLPSTFNDLQSASIELTRRNFRLLISMAVPENEEFLSSYLFSKDKNHESLVEILNGNIYACKKELCLAAQKESQLTVEKEEYRKKMDAQSVRFWREVQRVKKSNTEETTSKVSIFDAERKLAERRVQDMSKQVREAESRAVEASESAKASHRAEIQAQAELNKVTQQVVALGEQNEELKRQLGQKDAAIGDIKEQMANMGEDRKQLEIILGDKENLLASLEEGRDGMEANLSNLFSDLVKVTNMYESQEQQGKDLSEKNRSLAKKLQEEQRLREESEERLRSENQQLRAEKEKIERKLAKYKEKLENERQERKDMEQKQKRRAPTNYINNLHDSRDTSTIHAKKGVRSSESQRIGSKSQARTKHDKENDYMRESQRSSRHREESQQGSRPRDDRYVSSNSFRPQAYR